MYVCVRILRLCVLWLFFFFKQKTAYEMRISDWSSDVCSSDLARRKGGSRRHGAKALDPEHRHDDRNWPFTMMFGIMPCIANTGTRHDHHPVRTEELRHLPQGAQVARPLRRGPRIHRLPRRKTQPGNPAIGRANV